MNLINEVREMAGIKSDSTLIKTYSGAARAFKALFKRMGFSEKDMTIDKAIAFMTKAAFEIRLDQHERSQEVLNIYVDDVGSKKITIDIRMDSDVSNENMQPGIVLTFKGDYKEYINYNMTSTYKRGKTTRFIKKDVVKMFNDFRKKFKIYKRLRNVIADEAKVV
jgi:hypothetical protein